MTFRKEDKTLSVTPHPSTYSELFLRGECDRHRVKQRMDREMGRDERVLLVVAGGRRRDAENSGVR